MKDMAKKILVLFFASLFSAVIPFGYVYTQSSGDAMLAMLEADKAKDMAFSYLGRDDDRVSRTAIGGNSVSDGHFRLNISFSESVQIKALRVDGLSSTLGNYGIWKTDQYPYWIAGVYMNGALLNQGYKSSLGSFSGDVRLDIYCNANASNTIWLAEADEYTVTVYLSDGSSISQRSMPAGIDSFEFIAWDEDKLSSNVPGVPGDKDAHFRLNMNFDNHMEIESIKLSDMKKYYLAGLETEYAWHTKSQDYRMLAVYGNAVEVPAYSGYKNTIGVFSGDIAFEIYCEPYSQTKFEQGDMFEVTVNFKDGTSLSAQTEIDNTPRVETLEFVKALYQPPGTPCHFDIGMTIPKEKEIMSVRLDIMPRGLNWSTDRYQYVLCVQKDKAFINTGMATTLGTHVGEVELSLYPMCELYLWYCSEAELDLANNSEAVVKVTFADGSTAQKTMSIGNAAGGFGDAGKPGFSDMDSDHWAYEAMQFMQQSGLIKGYDDGTFKPDRQLTRAEFAKILVLALGDTSEAAVSPSFADVGYQHWAFEYVESAKRYIEGESVAGEMLFHPERAITREEVAEAVVKAKGMEGMQYSESTLDGFADRSSISDDREKYVAIAAEKGLMNGTDTGFEPKASLTRAQACVLFYRMLVQ